MLKCKHLKKATAIIASLTVCQYITAILFYIYQGNLVNYAIKKTVPLKYIVSIFLIMMATKVLMMLSNIISQNITTYFTNKEFDYQFKTLFPSRIFKDQVNLSPLFYKMVSENISSYFSDCLSILNNKILFIVVILLYGIFIVFTKSYIIALLAGILVLFSLISQILWGNKADDKINEIEMSKQTLLIWINQYFSAFKEVSRTWDTSIKSKRWMTAIISKITEIKQSVFKYFLKMNLVNQMLIEIPFLITTGVIFIEVYKSNLSLPLAFAWLGITQFIITASKGLSENVKLTKNRKINKLRIDQYLAEITEKKQTNQKEYSPEKKKNYNSDITVKLQDNTIVYLSAKPGLYQITGGNGSGKSTLLDIILKFDRQSKFAEKNIINMFSYDDVRIIDTNCVIFSMLQNFENQVMGPRLSKHDNINNYLEIIESNMSSILQPRLVKEWLDVFIDLSVRYDKRNEKRMSSGEKVILSFARNMYSWTKDIKLFIVDECDSPLDSNNKKLFIKTINSLSQHIAVYVVSHNHFYPMRHKTQSFTAVI